jgi:hypothetical protein
MEQERRQTGAAAAAIAELNTWEAIKKSKLKQAKAKLAGDRSETSFGSGYRMTRTKIIGLFWQEILSIL